MSIVKTVLTELWGLFVDDGSLALALVGWVALAIWLLPASAIDPAAHAPILFVGCLSILLINVLVASRQKSR